MFRLFVTIDSHDINGEPFLRGFKNLQEAIDEAEHLVVFQPKGCEIEVLDSDREDAVVHTARVGK